MSREDRVQVADIAIDSRLPEGAEIVKFEGNNEYFFWKVSGNKLSKDCRVVVPPTHNLIMIKDGVMQNVHFGGTYDVFEVEKKGGLFSKAQYDAIDVDFIFINNTIKYKVLWGTKTPVRYRDPISEKVVDVRGNGAYEVMVDNPKQFYLEIIGSMKKYSIEDLRSRIHDRLLLYFEDALLKVIRDNVYTYLDIQRHKLSISESLLPVLNEYMVMDNGLKLSSFTIVNMGISTDDQKMIEEEYEKIRKELKEKKEAKEIADQLNKMRERELQGKIEEEEIKYHRAVLLKQIREIDRSIFEDVLLLLKSDDELEVKEVKEEVVFCTNCGTKNPKGAKFCSECGNKLNVEHRCPTCNTILTPGAKFCMECGTKVA